jgi:hypothetical protein
MELGPTRAGRGTAVDASATPRILCQPFMVFPSHQVGAPLDA